MATVNYLFMYRMQFILTYMLQFQFAVNRGPRPLVQCIAVNVSCLRATFKERRWKRLPSSRRYIKSGEQTGSD